MAAEELVERVGTGHVQRQARVAAAGAAPHLAQAGHGAGEGHADRGVQAAHVDPQLQRVGGHHGQQLSGHQARLDLAPLGRRVAGAVGSDQLRQVGPPALLQAQPREPQDQLHAAARAQEADRAHLLLHEVREEVGRLGQRRRAGAGALVDQRGVPHRDPPLRAGGALPVHQGDLAAREALGQLHRICDRGAGQHESRLGPIGQCQPPQTPQNVGHVRAEHPSIDVSLVHHDPREVGQQIPPSAVVGEGAHVQHVRVGQDQVRSPADGRALLVRRVAVVDRRAHRRQPERVQGTCLVLRQRLGGVEVECPRGGVAAERVEHGQVERERLAAGGAGGDDRVPLERRGQRVGLMGVEVLHPGPGQRLAQGRMEHIRHGLEQGVLGALAGARHELLALTAFEQRLPGHLRAGRGHRFAIVRAA